MAGPRASDLRATDRVGALAGVRVLELADQQAAYCGKLLANLGADVIKVVPADRSQVRTNIEPNHFCEYHDAGKRSVALNLDGAAGRDAFDRLIESAHVLVHTLRPSEARGLGLDAVRLLERHPALVVASVTGFGACGPHAEWASDDIVASALGGLMHVTGHAEDPPVRLAGDQAWIASSTCAAAATLIALRHARRTGVGQLVDISVQDVVTSVTHICGVGKWLDDGIVPRRLGTGLFASVPSGAYRCKDGWIYLMVNRPAHWRVLARWVNEVTGNQEVLDPMFDGPSSNRLPYRELLDIFLGELMERFTVAELYAEGQRRHLAVTPVSGALRVLADEHPASRGYFVDVEARDGTKRRHAGAPYVLRATPWRAGGAAPAVGEHSEDILCNEMGLSRVRMEAACAPRGGPDTADAQSVLSRGDVAARAGGVPGARAGVAPVPGAGAAPGPGAGVAPGAAARSAATVAATTPDALAGIRVLELTAGMAGPWIGRFMAYCGAEVIKVESRDYPDVTRLYVPPRAPELGIQPQLSPWFTDWNAGKRFISLNLRSAAAVELCKRIVARCDVVVANYSAGVLDKLGLGYGELRRAREDLVMLSSTGYGSTGPNRGYVTWGPNIEALSGLATLSGFRHRDCTITQFAYPDALGALHGLVAVMAALAHRDRCGEGQFIDLSQYETTVSALGVPFLEAAQSGSDPARTGNGSSRAAPHGCYRCSGEDRWCAISVRSDEQWRRLCEHIGARAQRDDASLATLAGRLARGAELDALLESWTRARDVYDVMRELQTMGIAAGVVQTVEDQYRRDEGLAARAFFEKIAHAKLGTVTAAGIPLGLTGTPGRTRAAGAAIGADNEHVFSTLLDLDAAEIASLVAQGAIEDDQRH